MLENNHKTLHLKIYGRVQGVGYRYWTVQTAKNLNLIGWVRNRKDGSVEAIISGAKDNIDEMLRACYKGPSFANVEKIDIELGEYSGENIFKELPTI